MLNSAAHVLIRERRGEDADTEEKSQGKMDAKIGLMFPQAKKHLDSPEETGKDSPSELLGGVVCAKTLVSDFCCLELEIIHFRHFSCHVMGICLTAPGTLYTCVLCIILVILAPWETPFIHSFSAYYSLGPGNINTKRVSQCLWGVYSLGVMGEGGGSLTALTGKSRHLQIPGLTCALPMAELLSLDTILIFRMDKSLSLGCSVACGMMSNIPSLCPLEANSMSNPSPLLQSKLYPDIAKYISPVDAKLYPVENHRCMCMAFLCLEHYCPWAVGKLFLSFWILKHGCFSFIPKAVCANFA